MAPSSQNPEHAPMSTERLEEIAEVAADAPDGPWDFHDGIDSGGYADVVAGMQPGGAYVRRIARLEVEYHWDDQDNLDAAEDGDEDTADEDADKATWALAEFIATSRSAVPELVTEVQRLRVELAARPTRAEVLRDAAEELRQRCPDHGDSDYCVIVCQCVAVEVLDDLAKEATGGEDQ